MKNIIILLTFLCAITSYAVAPYGIKGQQQAATLYSNVHQFPNNQVTNLGGINALVETGNTNILSNPSFEHSTFSTSWTNSAGTFTQETSVVINGKASAKLVLAAQTMSLTQSSTLYAAQFADGVQGLAMVRIKSDIALSVCSIQAGTVSTTNCVTTTTDSKWGLYKIPFVMGATSQGISIASTGSVTGTVYIDDAFVGATNIVQDIDQSRIAGESYFASAASCTPTRTNTAIGAFTADADCVAPTIVRSNMGTWATTDSNGPIQIVNNLDTGEYIAEFEFSAYNSTSANTGWAINDGTTTCNSTAGFSGSSTGSPKTVSCSFKYTSSGNRTFQLYTGSSTGSVNISLDDLVRGGVRFKLIYYGSGKVYSSQCGANCVDVFSAQVSSAGAGVPSAENVDFISGNCVLSGVSGRVCTFNTGIFTVAPNCTASSGGEYHTLVSSVTSSAVTVFTYNNLHAQALSNFNIICQKQGADFVATRTIQGSFNEVVTSPGISKPKVCHYFFGQSTATLAAPVVLSSGTAGEVYDSCGAGSAPAFSATGTYINLTFANGTWANSTPLDCRCEAFGTGAGQERDCVLYFDTGDQTWSTTSSGGAVLNFYTAVATGTASNTYVKTTCTSAAP